MNCEVGRTCPCMADADCSQVEEELAGWNLDCEKKDPIGDEADDKSEVDSSDDGSDDGSEDSSDDISDDSVFDDDIVDDTVDERRDYISVYLPCKGIRSVAEVDKTVQMSVYSYIYVLKEEYRPKDASKKRAFCKTFLERVVDSFASEALRGVDEYGGDFEALLTKDEHEKLSDVPFDPQHHRGASTSRTTSSG